MTMEHIYFWDSATHQRQKFIPRDEENKKIGIYVCGPTVYDRIHIGNARPLVVFDVLVRFLRLSYDVTYVRNITDIDDKINKRASDRGIDIQDLTKTTIQAFHEDVKAMGCLPPDHEPRATQTIEAMLDHIKVLIEAGHAYEAKGHVLFDVASWPEYGQFSGKSMDDLIVGARVEVAPYKKNPTDFVLWKPSQDNEPGWSSAYGRGRPGWHIECSAMSKQYLGDDFDIHGGGLDLIFPHHQNEVAQSVCVHPPHQRKDRFARTWMHNGYVLADGVKMSKSLGNFYLVHDLLADYPGEALRLALLKTHYRAPLDFTKERMGEAKRELDRFYRFIEDKPTDGGHVDEGVLNALRDDVNTPQAIAILHELADKGDYASLKASAKLLGLLNEDPALWRQGKGEFMPNAHDGLDDEAILSLINERKQAKQNKDFVKADAIREKLKSQNILLEDKPDGQTLWRKS